MSSCLTNSLDRFTDSMTACLSQTEDRSQGCCHLTFARGDNVLLFVKVVLVALDVAAATLQGRRRFEDMPQRLGTGLTVGREVI